MSVVKYTDNDGYIRVVIGDANLKEKDYPAAPYLGPPDLGGLGLSKFVTKKLHNGLAELDIYNAEKLLNRRADVLKLFDALKIEKDRKRQLFRELTHLFQKEYYVNEEIGNE